MVAGVEEKRNDPRKNDGDEVCNPLALTDAAVEKIVPDEDGKDRNGGQKVGNRKDVGCHLLGVRT